MKKFLLSLSVVALAMSAAAQTETVYFQEDFEWIAPWAQAGKDGGITPAGKTIEENNNDAACPQLSACKIEDETSLFDAMKANGYTSFWLVTLRQTKKVKLLVTELRINRST